MRKSEPIGHGVGDGGRGIHRLRAIHLGSQNTQIAGSSFSITSTLKLIPRPNVPVYCMSQLNYT